MSHRILAVALLALPLAACHSGRRHPVTVPPDLAAEGREAYERSCASCHGPAGRGDGPVAPALRTAPADLTILAASSDGVFPRDEVIAIVVGDRPLPAHGTREMPVWAQRYEPTGDPAAAAAALVQRRRLDLLVDHIERLQSTGAPAPR